MYHFIALKNHIPRLCMLILVTISMIISFRLVTPSDFYLPPEEIETISTADKQTNNTLAPIVFYEQSMQWGLTALHHQSSKKLTDIREVTGSGACVIDADGDGWEDVFIIGGSGEHRFYGREAWWDKPHAGNSLWRNVNGSRLENITDSAAIPTAKWPMGCAVADVDNDGDSDLLITNIGPNQLLINDGTGQFIDHSAAAGLADHSSWSTSAAVADYNGDGRVDIYVANYLNFQKGSNVLERDSGYSGSTQGAFDAQLYDSQSNHLYTNQGNLKFTDQTVAAGVEDAHGRSQAALWLDINRDNHPDLLVLNSKGAPNRLFINNRVKKGNPAGGDKLFQENPQKYRIASTTGAHSAVTGDIDNDGDLDIVVSSPAGTPPKLLLNGYRNGLLTTEPMIGLSDMTWELGLASNRQLYQQGWGMVLADFNNDHFADLFIGNGAPIIDMDSPYATVAQRDQLLVNRGRHAQSDQPSEQFMAMPFAANQPSSTRGVISADFNQDGKIDLLTTQNNDFVRLLINHSETQQPWIGIALASSGDSPIGARVRLVGTDQPQVKTYTAKSGYLSQSSSRLHFVLPQSKINSDVDIEINWPDGGRTAYTDLTVDRYWQLNHDGSQRALPSQQPVPVTTDAKLIASFLLALDWNAQIEFLSSIRRILHHHEGHWQQSVGQALQTIFRQGDSALKQSVVNAAPQLPTTYALLLVREALEATEPSVRQAAIKALKRLEQERSVNWLLTHTEDPDPDVRCEVANTFAHFFAEEEAVIKRKRLGIPALVRLLEDEHDRVQICAAQALAEAESYRAVMPLVNILNHSSSAEVRQQSIRALGLIRHQHAIDPLLTALDNFQQDSSVVAHSLIALKRLNYPKLDQLLQRHLYSSPQTAVGQQFAVATELFLNDEDNTVFGRDTILSQFSEIIQALKQDQHQSGQWVVPALELIAALQLPSAESTLRRYLSHPDADIAATSLRILAKTQQPEHSLEAWGFYQQPALVKQNLLADLLANGYQPKIHDMQRLIAAPQTREPLTQHIHQQGYAQLPALLSKLSNNRYLNDFFQLCATQTSPMARPTTNWFSKDNIKNSPWIYKALNCWLKTPTPATEATSPPLDWLTTLLQGNHPERQLLAVEALAKHPNRGADQWLIRTIKDRSQPITLRSGALQQAVKYNKVYGLELALALAKKDGAVSDVAIHLIATHATTSKYHALLKQRAADSQRSASQRWPAIAALLRQTDQNIMDYLSQ